MSGRKTKEIRRKNGKPKTAKAEPKTVEEVVEGKAEDKPKASAVVLPKRDLARTKATLAVVQQVELSLHNRINDLEKRLGSSFKSMHENDMELLKGMQASEFNLRTHQKVLNALSAEVQALGKAVSDGSKYERATLLLTELKSQDGAQVKTVIDWSAYHEFVKSDLKELAEQQRLMEERKARAKKIVDAVHKLYEQLSGQAMLDLATRIEAGEKILKDEEGKEFELEEPEQKHVANMLRAGAKAAKQKRVAELMTERLQDATVEQLRLLKDEADKLELKDGDEVLTLDDHDLQMVRSMIDEGLKAKEGPEGPPPAEPEGATVFGGDA